MDGACHARRTDRNRIAMQELEYMTIDEAATFCKMSRQTMHKYKWHIGYSQPDRKILIKKSDLIAWLDNFKIQKIN